MAPTGLNLVPSGLHNVLNFRDVAQSVNQVQGKNTLREGQIFRSARPVRTFGVPLLRILDLSRTICLFKANDSCRLLDLT